MRSQGSSKLEVWLGKLGFAALSLMAALVVAVSGALAGSDLLPAATALPCPDGSQTCGPQPTQDPGPTQGNQGPPTTAPQAPQTTIPPNTDTGTASAPTQGGNGFQGTVQAMPTPDNPNGCIANCPTQGPQNPATTVAPPTQAQQSPTTEPPSQGDEGQTYEGRTVSRCETAAEQMGVSWTPAGVDVVDLLVSTGGGRSVIFFRSLPTSPCACGDDISAPDGQSKPVLQTCPDGQHSKPGFIGGMLNASCYNDYNLYLQSDKDGSRAVNSGDKFIICLADHPCTGTHTVTRQLQLSTSTTSTSTAEVAGKVGKGAGEISAKISDAIAVQNSVTTTTGLTDAVPIFYPVEKIPAGQHITGSTMIREIPYAVSGIGTKAGYPDFISYGTAKIPVTTVCWQLMGVGPCLP